MTQKVSVVIPTRNRPQLTVRAIASAVAQSLQPHEIIVVDDASDDSTIESVRRAYPAVKILRHDRHRGGAAARNTGIDIAGGKWVAFLDSDDEWLPTKIERQIASCLAAGGPERPTVCFTTVRREKKLFPDRGPMPGEALLDYFYAGKKRFIQTSSIVLPRWLATKVRFTDGLPLHQDADFCIRLAAVNAQFVYVPEPLSVWHVDAQETVSRSACLEDTLDWYAAIADGWPRRIRLGFEKNVILPRLVKSGTRPAFASSIILRALVSRTMALKKVALLGSSFLRAKRAA